MLRLESAYHRKANETMHLLHRCRFANIEPDGTSFKYANMQLSATSVTFSGRVKNI